MGTKDAARMAREVAACAQAAAHGKEREERDVSAGNRDDVRRAREELMSIEQSRLRLPERVMRGEAEALEEDQHLETRLRELAHWLMSAEQQDEEGSGTSWEGRGRRWG
jgi:signal transduction histidine kinase